jgi:ectoine hydroxylase-related dioxygenase (phytanoyl-CoA dioxygenase family)
MPTTTASRLDRPYELTDQQVQQFRADGFIKLKNVFTADELAEYGEEITRLTLQLNPNKDKPLEERDTYGKAFIQVGNLWTKSAKAKALSFSRRIARIATELLGTGGVRMWHDQALYKEPGGGFTPWHADQQYWPMATGKTVTAWVPLQATPIEMGPLCFAKGSHLKNIGRDIAISDDSERLIREEIAKHKLIEVYEPYDLGEVSFHLGWTLHRAGPNTTDQPRKVHTVIYMDREMRLAEPRNANQQADWEAWTPSTQIGQVMDDELNPVLYPAGA